MKKRNNMFTQKEVDILIAGIKCWIKEPINNGMLMSIMSLAILGKQSDEDNKKELTKASIEKEVRKRIGNELIVKLSQQQIVELAKEIITTPNQQ